MKKESSALHGTLTSLKLYQQWGRGVVRAADGAYHVVVGNALAGLLEGNDYAFTGRPARHPKFGDQFEVERASIDLKADPQSLVKYLRRHFRGCGEVTARRLVDHHARQGTLDALREAILQRPWSVDFSVIAGRRAVAFKARADETVADYIYRHLALHVGGVAGVRDNVLRRLATHLLAKCGDAADPVAAAWQIFRDDPYEPIAAIVGYGFVAADALGAYFKIPRDAACRLAALAVHAMTEGCEGFGHVFLRPDQLRERIAAVDVTVDPGAAVQAALEAGMPIVLDEGMYYLRRLLDAEKSIACHLWALMADAGPIWKGPGQISAERLQAAARTVSPDITLDPSQVRALIGILTARTRLHTLTAGPGCGKTALMETLTALLPRTNIAFCAPTGKAAKVLSGRIARFGHSASTIHALLGVTETGFVHGPEDPLPEDILVIDESSMADLELAQALLSAVHNQAHVIVLGDRDQLPSVAPGAVLDDILRLPADHHRLDTTHRNRGGILALVRQIRDGAIVIRDAPDLHFTGELGEAAAQFPDVVNRYLAAVRRCGIENVGLLMSRRKGKANEAGWNTTYANAVLRPVMNPGGAKVPGTTFHIGDRIIVRRNMLVAQSDDEHDPHPASVVNGDTGTIVGVQLDGEGTPTWLVLQLDDGRRLRFPATAIDVLNHAYALTVHAAQGSEYRIVIMVVTNGTPSFMHRGAVYTAASRAREHLTVIADPRVLHQVVARPAPQRNSRAVERITRMHAK